MRACPTAADTGVMWSMACCKAAGRVDYPNGSWYAGQFDQGQWHGQANGTGSNGEVYKGQFKQGLFDGQAA